MQLKSVLTIVILLAFASVLCGATAQHNEGDPFAVTFTSSTNPAHVPQFLRMSALRDRCENETIDVMRDLEHSLPYPSMIIGGSFITENFPFSQPICYEDPYLASEQHRMFSGEGKLAIAIKAGPGVKMGHDIGIDLKIGIDDPVIGKGVGFFILEVEGGLPHAGEEKSSLTYTILQTIEGKPQKVLWGPYEVTLPEGHFHGLSEFVILPNPNERTAWGEVEAYQENNTFIITLEMLKPESKEKQ